ncbi:MAG: hypothetical protein ABIF10_02425 [Candidatus Woesearchaeota archaeon]
MEASDLAEAASEIFKQRFCLVGPSADHPDLRRDSSGCRAYAGNYILHFTDYGEMVKQRDRANPEEIKLRGHVIADGYLPNRQYWYATAKNT